MPVKTELTLRLPNSPGALRAVIHTLVREGVSVLAVSLESGGHLRLLVDHVARAEGLLLEQHRSVTAKQVLVVPTACDRHALSTTLGLVADVGVNIDYAYAANPGPDGGVLVLGVADALRVATATGL
jgi:hypothetical protein